MMMRMLLVVVAYTAFALGANAAPLDGLLVGDMKKLAVHATPVDLPDAVLLDAADAEVFLTNFRGHWLVLNFWATWCAPCRVEMPSLDRLQAAMPDLRVLPVATGRNPIAQIVKFNTDAGIAHLDILRDPKSALARDMGVFGLPVTVIINPQGQEVARLIGDAEWDSDAAKAVLAAMMAP